MKLSVLVSQLEQHGVNLVLTETGKLRPQAIRPPPEEIIEAIRQHRSALVRRLERGQRLDGKYYIADLQQRPGICASCVWWRPNTLGNLMGQCNWASTLGIHGAHRCTEAAWTLRSEEAVSGK